MNRNISCEALYDLVWTMPMTHVAKELGLSDVRLRKICVKFGIPLPPTGHWARLQFGKQDPRPSLPFVNNNPQIRLPDEVTAATRDQISLMRKLAKKAEQAIQPVLRDPQQRMYSNLIRCAWQMRVNPEFRNDALCFDAIENRHCHG